MQAPFLCTLFITDAIPPTQQSVMSFNKFLVPCAVVQIPIRILALARSRIISTVSFSKLVLLFTSDLIVVTFGPSTRFAITQSLLWPYFSPPWPPTSFRAKRQPLSAPSLVLSSGSTRNLGSPQV